MANHEDRPWVSYAPVLYHVRGLWRHTMCRLGVHLFDEVYAFGAGLLDSGTLALAESATGLRAQPLLTGDPAVDNAEGYYLTCDACHLTVNLVGMGDDGR